MNIMFSDVEYNGLKYADALYGTFGFKSSRYSLINKRINIADAFSTDAVVCISTNLSTTE